MPWAPKFRSLARNLFHQARVEQDLDNEIRGYVEALTEEKIRSGISPAQARREALLEAGGVEQIKEQVRDARAGALVDSFLADMRYALRTLSAARGFSAVALLSLALGIGAAAAMFTLFNAVLIRPLPYANPGRLVRITDTYPEGAAAAIQRASRTMDLASFTTDSEYNLTGLPSGVAATAHVAGSAVSAGLFDLLGVRPQLGRVFRKGQNSPSHDRLVILSDALWRGAFHADPAVIGKPVTVDGVARTIVGVMPPNFDFPGYPLGSAAQLWIPLHLDPRNFVDYWAAGFMPLVGRLRPGITVAQATEELRRLIAQAIPQFPYVMARNWNSDAEVMPLRQAMTGDISGELVVLGGAVGIVLLIACVNLAGLLLSRSAARRKEFAVRAAVGASRRRIVRQIVTESVVLAMGGAGLGLLLAMAIISVLRPVLPGDAARLVEAGIDARVPAFAALVALLTGISSGLAPALTISRFDLAEAINAGGPRTAGGADPRLRRLLIAGEVALTVVLVIGAGLLIKSLWLLAQVNPWLRAERTVTARVYLDRSHCANRAAYIEFYEGLVRRARTITGVSDAAATSALPFSSDMRSAIPAEIEGQPLKPSEQVAPLLWAAAVTPDYFRMMRVPVIAGRAFTRADGPQAPEVVLVSQATAQHFWPGQNPLGKRVRVVWDRTWRTVVGVVADVETYEHTAGLSGTMYMPYAQSVGQARQIPAAMTIMVRTPADPARIGGQLRALVSEAGPGTPVGEVRTLEAVVSASTSQPRSMTWLFSGFGGAALLLVAIGVYGLIAYSVEQRRHEIGIRLALGAVQTDVYSLVLKQNMKYVLAGLACGLPAALALTRLMTGFLYHVSATDPATYAAVALVVIVVAAVAGSIPCLRALARDPTESLRVE